MDITFTASDPVLSPRIANTQAEADIDRGMELRRRLGEIVRAFLRRDLAAIGQKVREAETALNAYREKTGIPTFQANNSNRLEEKRMIALEQDLTKAVIDGICLSAEMHLIEAGHYDSLPEVIADRTIQALEPEVAQLGAQYAAMAAMAAMAAEFMERSPPAAKVKAQLVAAEAQLALDVAIVTEQAVEKPVG